MMREGSGRLPLPRDELNLEKFSIPFSCFLILTLPSHSPPLAHSSSISFSARCLLAQRRSSSFIFGGE